jgi:hypothetical protein
MAPLTLTVLRRQVSRDDAFRPIARRRARRLIIRALRRHGHDTSLSFSEHLLSRHCCRLSKEQSVVRPDIDLTREIPDMAHPLTLEKQAAPSV